MISIVLTTHDGYSKYLKRAIDSVVAQTHTDWELIVVKDGGRDEHSVVDSYTDSRIKYLHIKKFGNHTRPKNVGTIESRGGYVAYLDADNEYLPDHLTALLKEITKSGVDVVYGDRNIVKPDGNKMVGVKSDFNLSLLSRQNYIDTNDVLCRKEAVDSVGGWDEALEYFADWNLWVRMAKAGYKFKRLPLIITNYYYHGKNNVLKCEKGGMNFDVQGCKIWPDKTLYGRAPDVRVAVYTMTYDRLRYTQETFITMREKTKHPFDHFVLDQASSDKTWLWLCDQEKEMSLTIERVDKNIGISAGSEKLLEMIRNKEKEQGWRYDLIIKVDNDCEFVTDEWLEQVLDVYSRSRMIVMSPYVEGLIDHPGGVERVRNGYIDKHYVGIVDHLGGICVVAPRPCYDQRIWEDKDYYHGMQDAIFSRHCRERGYLLVYLENTRIKHMFNTSFSSRGEDMATDEEVAYRERRKTEKITKYNPNDK